MRHHKKPYSRELSTPTRSRQKEPRTPGSAGIFSFVRNLFSPRRAQNHEIAEQELPDTSEDEQSIEMSTAETPTVRKQSSLAELPDFSSFATSARQGNEKDASPTSMLAEFFAQKQEQNTPLTPVEMEGVISLLSRTSAPSTPLMSKSTMANFTAMSEGQSKEVRPTTSYHPLFTPGRQRNGAPRQRSHRTILQQSTSTPFGERKLVSEDNLPQNDPEGKRQMDTMAMPEAKRMKTKESSPKTQSKTAQTILSIIGDSPPPLKDEKKPGSMHNTTDSMSPFLNPYATNGVKKSPKPSRATSIPSPPARSAIEEIERTAKKPSSALLSPNGTTSSKNLFMFPSDRMKSARTFAERYKPARSSGLKEEMKEIRVDEESARKISAVQSGQTPRPKFVFGTPSNSFKFRGPVSSGEKAENKPSQLGENSFGILEDADDGDEDAMSDRENKDQQSPKPRVTNGSVLEKPLTVVIDLDDDSTSTESQVEERHSGSHAFHGPTEEPKQPDFVFKPPPKSSSTKFYRASDSSDEEENTPPGPAFVFKQPGAQFGDHGSKLLNANDLTGEISAKNDSGSSNGAPGFGGQSTGLQVLQVRSALHTITNNRWTRAGFQNLHFR